MLITVSSSHRFQGTHKHIWVYHFLFAFCFSYEQRNVRRWMLHKYVGNMLKESTLLNNEHEHVKRYYAYKDITFNIKNISQNIIYIYLNHSWIVNDLANKYKLVFSPFHFAQNIYSFYLSLFSKLNRNKSVDLTLRKKNNKFLTLFLWRQTKEAL